jgi:hypothetical protein
VSSKDFRRILAELRRQGFDVRRGGSGHYVVTSPDGQVASVSATPSSGQRTLANTRAALRRIGAAL